MNQKSKYREPAPHRIEDSVDVVLEKARRHCEQIAQSIAAHKQQLTIQKLRVTEWQHRFQESPRGGGA